MRSKPYSQSIIDDYHGTSLSVRQIARKHDVCVRTVYNIVGNGTDHKGWKRQNKRYLSLTRHETETLLNAIVPESKYSDPADLIHGIIERLNRIKEDLPV